MALTNRVHNHRSVLTLFLGRGNNYIITLSLSPLLNLLLPKPGSAAREDAWISNCLPAIPKKEISNLEFIDLDNLRSKPAVTLNEPHLKTT